MKIDSNIDSSIRSYTRAPPKTFNVLEQRVGNEYPSQTTVVYRVLILGSSNSESTSDATCIYWALSALTHITPMLRNSPVGARALEGRRLFPRAGGSRTKVSASFKKVLPQDVRDIVLPIRTARYQSEARSEALSQSCLIAHYPALPSMDGPLRR